MKQVMEITMQYCTITQSNDIGAISQSNTASSNVLNINQDGQATNNCDDTTSGDNDSKLHN